MRIKELEEEIAKYSYKPGSEFKLITPDEYFKDIVIALVMSVQDVNTLNSIQIKNSRRISIEELYQMDSFRVLDILRDLVVDLEQHERHEWFRYQGICVTNPHPQIK